MLPSRMDVLFNLVGLYARSGDRARARDLIETVLSRGADRAMVEEARESLLQPDLQDAQDLIQRQEDDEALRKFEAVPSATPRPGLRKELPGPDPRVPGAPGR